MIETWNDLPGIPQAGAIVKIDLARPTMQWRSLARFLIATWSARNDSSRWTHSS
jgi:hypothetical protein